MRGIESPEEAAQAASAGARAGITIAFSTGQMAARNPDPQA
jgi:hypothetical protein